MNTDWAQDEAAKLPPFNVDDIAELGAVAARLDAKRHQRGTATLIRSDGTVEVRPLDGEK